MEEIQIRKVSGLKGLNQFLDAGNFIKSSEHNYIAPLRMSVSRTLNKKKNPLWKEMDYELFIARKSNAFLGRIAVIYRKNHSTDTTGYFGYFDFVNDSNVARLLLARAAEIVKQQGCTTMIGPINPTPNYELGVLTKGYDVPPFFMMSYNPYYYDRLITGCGGKLEMKFQAFQ
ncbi:MAG: hypothetical protein P8X57_09235, partial [Cyclobacteriaceae bacterium]